MKKMFLLCLIFISVSISAQDNILVSKFQILLDYHYNLGLVENGDLAKITRSDFKMYGNSIHLSGLYNLNPKIALGVGIGLDRYENHGFNTLPIYLTAHYKPLYKLPSGYIFSNLGYGLDTSDFIPGALFDIGIGYKKMFRKHFGLNFQLGYNLKQQKGNLGYIDEKQQIVHDKINRYRHSLSFGIGLIF
ncbi:MULTISPECIES: hypothetical protein [Bacteroidales]|uniref:hypothetical protein n=1 Tax=Bacteroidales TaxID=171549 RepID=UPI0013D7C07C|nr:MULTISPECIES: hypothetical protein [Bacteroidales]MDH6313100.1 hypothetical protein [Parabacteroides sp. PFB2-10]NDV82872.1 hypothetical protein [Bacteroides sp. 51]